MENVKTIMCPICHQLTLEGSSYCCMCGISLEEARIKMKERDDMKKGRIPLTRKIFMTDSGKKTIEVYCHDITTFPEDIDVLTISAYSGSYNPAPRSVIRALENTRHITVGNLLIDPMMDLRSQAHCWLSKRILNKADIPWGKINHIACVEMRNLMIDLYPDKEGILQSITTYFRMLDVASAADVKISTIAMPLLGSGNQNLNTNLIAIPLINETIDFLKRNPKAERVIFIEYTYDKADLLAQTLNNSYQIAELIEKNKASKRRKEPFVFISYSARGDHETAEMICHMLKERGIKYWFAGEAIKTGNYASQIVEAIDKSTHFICIISPESMESEHVLNEIDLAFNHLKDGIQILPYRLDDGSNELKEAFRYYLSRMQWHCGFPPPAEERAVEFINDIFGENSTL